MRFISKKKAMWFSIVKETRTYRSIHKRYLMRCKIDVYLIHKYSLQCINIS